MEHRARHLRGQRRRRRLPVPQLLIVVGLVLCLAPVVSNLYWQQVARENVSSFTSTAEAVDPETKEHLLAQARAYNARLGGYEDQWANEVLAGEEVWEYDDQLSIDGDEAIGWVEVPKCGIEMTVYHGVGEPALSSGVGHQPETSLPVGGERSHCYLTGHSGMRQFRVFDGIRALEVGDVFAVHVLGDTYAYRVTGWEIVDPDGVDVAPGDGDLCTLVTCTTSPDPWNPKGRIGINDKRLLVHGERCEYDPSEFEDAEASPAASVYVNDNTRPALIAAALLALTGLALLGTRVVRRLRRRSETRREEHRREQ